MSAPRTSFYYREIRPGRVAVYIRGGDGQSIGLVVQRGNLWVGVSPEGFETDRFGMKDKAAEMLARLGSAS